MQFRSFFGTTTAADLLWGTFPVLGFGGIAAVLAGLVAALLGAPTHAVGVVLMLAGVAAIVASTVLALALAAAER